MTVRCPAPDARFFGRRVCWFHVCGGAGLVASLAVAVVACELRRLSLSPVVPLLAIAVATFLTVGLATKVITGEERLTYYHHQLAILGVSAVFLHVTGRPLLAYLDVLAAGIGGFLVCGRVGCFLVGCCHGRPARWGVVYRTDHAAVGFPGAYVGVTLVPVQLMESGAVALIVAVAVRASSPGAGLVVAVVGYATARFCLEWLRGDARPSFAGLSEAQWTSALVGAAMATIGFAGFR